MFPSSFDTVTHSFKNGMVLHKQEKRTNERHRDLF